MEWDLRNLWGMSLLNDFGGPELNWRTLGGFIENLPRDSATYRSLHPDDSLWTLEAQLLAAEVDAVNAGNWQRGGGKGTRPKQMERPGVGPAKTKGSGVTGATADEAARAIRQRIAQMAARGREGESEVIRSG